MDKQELPTLENYSSKARFRPFDFPFKIKGGTTNLHNHIYPKPVNLDHPTRIQTQNDSYLMLLHGRKSLKKRLDRILINKDWFHKFLLQ